jgi:hypothetical protein
VNLVGATPFSFLHHYHLIRSWSLMERRDLLSSRQKSCLGALAAALLSTSIGLGYSSSLISDHFRGVLFLPGLITTLCLTFVAPILTYKVIESTKDSFLAKGFGGRDLLKASDDKIPESLGLPTSILYCMLMFCFIPFRYGGLNSKAEMGELSNTDGGWNGDMTGKVGFPHHSVRSLIFNLLRGIANIDYSSRHTSLRCYH